MLERLDREGAKPSSLKLVIMDEPIAALAENIVAILISHRLADAFEVSDRIIKLRQSEMIVDEPVAATSRTSSASG